MIPSLVFTRPPSQWPLGPVERLTMLIRMAEDLARGHTHTPSSRPLNKDYELCGIAAEYAFARAFDLPMPRKDQWRGDRGIDFWIGLISIDVKGRAAPRAMLVEQGKVAADVYVDAHYAGDILDARLIGWAWAQDVKAIPPYDTGKGIINHKVSVLRPIDELHQLAATVGFAA